MPPLDITRMFSYHKPFGNQPERYVQIREMARHFAEVIMQLTPASAEQTLAIRSLQQCVMHANAAIAINEVEDKKEVDFTSGGVILDQPTTDKKS